VTETLTPNDKAYIKISQELLRLRNDHSVMQMIPTITSSMNQWHRAKLKEVRVGLHSEGREGWSELLNLISSDGPGGGGQGSPPRREARHQAGGDAQRFAAERDAIIGVEPVALGAALDLEIRTRLVREQHRVDV